MLPRGNEEWKLVTEEFNRGLDQKNKRDQEALKSKFNRIRSHPKPTGDPTCPDSVKDAKRIQKEIEERQSVADMGSETDDPVSSVTDQEFVLTEDGSTTAEVRLPHSVTTSAPTVVTTTPRTNPPITVPPTRIAMPSLATPTTKQTRDLTELDELVASSKKLKCNGILLFY
jgi:hypothetical protein